LSLISSDHTVISGDSFGHTQFWDGKTGTLIQDFKQHHGDVLSIAKSDDETMIFSAGVDSSVSLFQSLSTSANSKKWVCTCKQRKHARDVKCLVASNNRLYTGSKSFFFSQKSKLLLVPR
jgi:U3 small nucleolar RNA-associated protein 4